MRCFQSCRRSPADPRPADRVGAAAVEMAIVLMLLITLVFGIIEMGRAIMVNQVITNAAREARSPCRDPRRDGRPGNKSR